MPLLCSHKYTRTNTHAYCTSDTCRTSFFLFIFFIIFFFFFSSSFFFFIFLFSQVSWACSATPSHDWVIRHEKDHLARVAIYLTIPTLYLLISSALFSLSETSSYFHSLFIPYMPGRCTSYNNIQESDRRGRMRDGDNTWGAVIYTF